MKKTSSRRFAVRLGSSILAVVWLLSATAVAAKPKADPIASASALIDSGDPGQALELLTPWLKKHPADANALLLASTARFMLGDFEKGRQDLARSIELDSGNRRAWLNQAALELAEEDYTRALESFRQAETLDPDAADNALNIGAVLLLLDRFEEAGARFREYLSRNPGDPKARYLVASNYAMRGFADAAVANLSRAIALDEKMRRNARTDPNFAPLERSATYQRLLNTDGFRHRPGSKVTTQDYEVPYLGRRSLVLDAVISSLQLQGRSFEPQVEVTDRWALVWSDLRIKVASNDSGGTWLELSAPPGAFSAAAWQKLTTELLRSVTVQLHTRSRRPSDP